MREPDRVPAIACAIAAWMIAAASGEVLPNPTITAATPPSSAANAVAGIFDNQAEITEFRTAGAGNNTFIEFDFGAVVTIDGFVNVTRNSSSSVVTGSRLIFDDDGATGFNAATDSVVAFNASNTGSLGQGFVNRFAPVTTRRVRWEVTANSGSSHSCGAMEMRFLGSAADAIPIAGVGVVGGAPALDVYHALANAANGIAGRTPAGTTISPSVGYQSSGQGTGTFVDFDLGQARPVTGFDWFDNLATADRVNGFTLSFANDPSFAAPLAVKSYTGNTVFAFSDGFPAIEARYIRYQVTAAATNNPGLSELVFYQGPGSGLPGAFSAAANPATGWLHGDKATPQAAGMEGYAGAAAADAATPCDRWFDPEPGTAFAGRAPADATTAWGGVAADWSGSTFYHAWRDQHPFAITSRFTVPKSAAYDINATWASHTVPGSAATVWIVVNGATVASAALDGFAGTTHGTTTPSGPDPTAHCACLGLALAAGSTVDFVTVPLAAAGNAAVTAGLTEVTAPADITSTVVIREFCADNESGLRDEDGSCSDWIELSNGTGAAVDLADWSLTDRSDQPRMWIFPPRILPHGGRLVVFASNKDAGKRPGYGPGSELHTNFALAKSGEFLGLADPAGAFVSSFAPRFPAQFEDLSYGAGSNEVIGFMTPTPGTANGPAASAPPAQLAFSAASGVFSGTLDVSITGQSAGHTVRFTTDGSEPTLTNGATYSAPLAVTASTTLRARAFTDTLAGPLAHATYTLLGSSGQYGITPATFAGSLPLLVIDAAAAPPTDRTPVVARLTLIDRRAADGTTRLLDTPALATRAAVKLRGQTSAGLAKKPYAIELWDAADQDQPAEVLGMPAESDWVLYAAYQYDPDFLRNVLMFELYRRMGRWAPRTRFVELFFNASAASPLDAADYRGVYVLMEKVKVDSDRVDIAPMSPFDNSGDAVTGGFIIARDKWGNFETTHPELLTGTRNSYPNWPYSGGGDFVVKSPSVNDITAAQKAWIANYTMECDTAVARPDRRHPLTGLHIFDYLGRDSFIDHHMLNAFAKNVDGIRISTYLEKDLRGKLRMSSPWDFDRSQDSDADNRDDNPAAWNSDNSTISTDFFSVDGRQAEGWFHHLHQIPLYMQDWVDRYDRWRSTGVLDTAVINAFLDQGAAELTTADNGGITAADMPVARNFARWPRSTRGTSTNGANAATVIFGSQSTSELSRHKDWLAQRLAFMDTWVLRKPVPSLTEGVVPAGSALTLGSPDLTGAARIWFTFDGADPFADDGSIAAGALVWDGPLILTSSVPLTARLRQPSPTNKHSTWSAPLRAGYIVGATPADAASLVVSELMYHPADPTPDELAAGFSDAEDFEFIELRNAGSSRINLWNTRFTAGIESAFPSTLPAALAELDPGETILLVSNPAAFASRYGTAAAARVAGGFENGSQLSNSGEQIVIVDTTGATILDFTWSDLAPWPAAADGAGASLHFLTNSPAAAGNWFACTPTPGAAPADADGDGQSDLAEWWAGSDPGDPASSFRVTGFTVAPDGSATVTFPAAAGHRYRLECSTDLLTWLPAGDELSATESGPLAAVDPGTLQQPRFYRVIATGRP